MAENVKNSDSVKNSDTANSKDRKEEKNEEREVLTPVTHVQQSYSWDCGLACAKMVLKTFSLSTEDVEEICEKYNIGESVWTVDLAYLLKEYDVKFRFYTITLGVDETYASESFYQSHFSNDEHRINKFFKEAEENQIFVEKRSVPINEIVDHLMNAGLAIVLIDWNHLSCIKCREGWSVFSSLNVLSACLSSYQGHYITLCGCNKKDGTIYFRNPSYSDDTLCCCSYETLDEARKQYGTDEDIVLIYSKESTS